MKDIAKHFVGQKSIETAARILFALVFLMFGIGKYNADDARELAGLVTQHPVFDFIISITGPIVFAVLLGTVEIIISLLLFAGIKVAILGFVGAVLSTGAFIVTCSLILFVPVFREGAGFPFGNFTGLFLFKDMGLLACALLLVQIDAKRVVAEE